MCIVFPLIRHIYNQQQGKVLVVDTHPKSKKTFFFNPKTVFWTNVGKIVLIYFFKNTSLDLSSTRLGYFS